MCAVASLIMVQKEETREENEYNIARGYALFLDLQAQQRNMH